MPLDNPRFDVGAQRLARLADALDQLTGQARAQFNMSDYCSCAVHVAIGIPELAEAGLKDRGAGVPRFENFDHRDALRLFFEIDNASVVKIFFPPARCAESGARGGAYEDRRAHEVAETIRSVIRERVLA